MKAFKWIARIFRSGNSKSIEVKYEVSNERKDRNDAIEQIEGEMLGLPHEECPLNHIFAPGIYAREVFMRKGLCVIGHMHKERSVNIVLSGRAIVMSNGDPVEIVAPCVFISEPGVRKVAHIIEDMRWINVHGNPENETDVDKLEEMFIVKSDTFLQHQKAELTI